MAGNRERNQRSRGGGTPKTHLRLTTEEPSKKEGVWEIHATALASRSGRALEGESIQFYLDGNKFGNAVQIQSDGRAKQVIRVPIGAKRASVEAQLEGQPWVAREIVVLPDEPQRAGPSTYSVRLVGSEGKYRVVGIVHDAADKPASGVEVQILNASAGNIVRTLRTGQDGTFAFSRKVAEGEAEELKIWVMGLLAPNNPTTLRLVGRKEKLPKPKRRRQVKLQLVKSFKRGLQKEVDYGE